MVAHLHLATEVRQAFCQNFVDGRIQARRADDLPAALDLDPVRHMHGRQIGAQPLHDEIPKTGSVQIDPGTLEPGRGHEGPVPGAGQHGLGPWPVGAGQILQGDDRTVHADGLGHDQPVPGGSDARQGKNRHQDQEESHDYLLSWLAICSSVSAVVMDLELAS